MRRPKAPIPPNPVLPAFPDWRSVFGREAPLHLEIGSGHGGYALGFAAAEPSVNLIAIEWRRKFADWTRAKAAARGLQNVLVLGADARDELPRLFGEGSLQGIHLHFPDPWWKRRHQKRRLVDDGFAGVLLSRLAPGGLLDVRTDVLERAADMLARLEAVGFVNEAGAGRFAERIEGELPSTRERRYLASGDPVFRLRLARAHSPAELPGNAPSARMRAFPGRPHVRLKVLYHDRCFDGLSSAAVFSRFYREKIEPTAEIGYQGLAHQAGQVFPFGSFSGDENAVVDFRYSSDPKLTWWFDHHESAFPTPDDRRHFEQDRSGKKFFDPKSKSCTKFLCDTLVARFGFEAGPLAELVQWAQIIDGALFPDARTAVELEEPALQLMLAIEASQDEAARHRLIGEMQRRPLRELVALPDVRGSLDPALAAHRRTLELMKEQAKLDGRVVTFDLTPHGLETFNKFIAYYLFPQATYSVGVSGGASRTKVSVGSDPWHPERRRHDLSKLCERWGGGGHAVVAAITFPPGQADRARGVARDIVAELNHQ